MPPKSKSVSKAASSESAIRTVASFAGQSVEVLVAFAVTMFSAGQAAFVNAAKAMIAVEALGQDAVKLLKDAGVKPSSIANGRYLTRAWEYVTRGLLTESDFDALTFRDAYHLVRLADRMGGAAAVHQKGILAGGPDEWECFYEHRMSQSEWAAAEKSRQEKEASKAKEVLAAQVKAEADKAAKAAAGAAPAPVTAPATENAESVPTSPVESIPAAPAAATSTSPHKGETAAKVNPAKAGKSIADFNSMIDMLQKLAEELILDTSRPNADEIRASVHTRSIAFLSAVTTACEIAESEVAESAPAAAAAA
jgi:hypothetical protein